jgi:hypothetical protein
MFAHSKMVEAVQKVTSSLSKSTKPATVKRCANRQELITDWIEKSVYAYSSRISFSL